MFFLKAEEGKDGTMRVRVFCELENGFVGLVDESIKQAQPHLWTKFESGLKAYGESKAKKAAEKDGEFRLPQEARELGVIERDIEKAQGALMALTAERDKAVAAAKEAKKLEKAAEKTAAKEAKEEDE